MLLLGAGGDGTGWAELPQVRNHGEAQDPESVFLRKVITFLNQLFFSGLAGIAEGVSWPEGPGVTIPEPLREKLPIIIRSSGVNLPSIKFTPWLF